MFWAVKKEKREEQERIRQQTEEFLARGGTIHRVPTGEQTYNHNAMMGYDEAREKVHEKANNGVPYGREYKSRQG